MGSVGLRAYIALCQGSSPDDVVFLQLRSCGQRGPGRLAAAAAQGTLLPAVGVACGWLSQAEHAVGLEVDPHTEAAADPVEDGLQPRRVLA